MLKGKLVQLRPVQRADISYFLQWFNDPEVIQYLGLYLPMTEMAEQKYIEDLGTTRSTTDARFVIESINGEKGKPIGSIGLHSVVVQGKCQGLLFSNYVSISPRRMNFHRCNSLLLWMA